MQPIYILQINTAFTEASIAISKNGEVLLEINNPDQYDHAAFLQPAILELCSKTNVQLKELNAVSVINGPGSYTGLRVGLSSAKGICYALNIPLICVNTLDWMAKGNASNNNEWICAMIDARRNEVFTALYDQDGKLLMPATAMVLDENSFESELEDQQICFIGNGAEKWNALCKHKNAMFPASLENATHLAYISFQYYSETKFTDLAYSEPFYIKEFYSTQKK
jgi:tRNA threonylcarbamoyladenosine biosynthesis protein TsaB